MIWLAGLLYEPGSEFTNGLNLWYIAVSGKKNDERLYHDRAVVTRSIMVFHLLDMASASPGNIGTKL
jgi:hypothetical protein